MNTAEWVAVGVVIGATLGGTFAFLAGDRRRGWAFTALGLLGAVCLSIGLWGPHAGEHPDEPGAGLTAPLKP